MSKRTHHPSPEPGRDRPPARPRLAVLRPASGARAVGLIGMLLTSVAHAHAGERRVVIGHDGRMPLERAAGLGVAAKRFAATGQVECGGVRGVGQVTASADVVTSAAHVFFDEAGRPRAAQGRCVFIVDGPEGRQTIPLTPSAQLCGSTSPYGVSGRHDWGAARLAHPIAGIRAYELGTRVKAGDPIAVVAFEGGRKTVDVCHIRDVVTTETGARELRTDCVGFDGMSGAAYLTLDKTPKVLAVHVGFRSADPGAVMAYSDRHYTFGAAIGQVLRRALASAR